MSRMKLDDLEKKLIAVARANPPSDRVPPTFEKRIMALIAGRPVQDLFVTRSLETLFRQTGWIRMLSRC